MWKPLWYNCSPVCGSWAGQLYGKANGDLLQEDLFMPHAVLPRSAAARAPVHMAGHCWPVPPQEILKYSKAGLTQSVNEPDNHNSVITYLEPDILEYAVKWALESITMNKASRGDRIPAELFQILKDDAMKVLHSVYQQICKARQWPQDWKMYFHSNPKERQCQRMFKLPHNCTHLTH